MRKRLTKSGRMSVYSKTSGHCAYCGCKIVFDDMQVDHIIPLRRGGEDRFENMLPACRSCNHYKSSMTIEGFRQAVENMPLVLERDNVTYRNAVRFGIIIPNVQKVVFYFEKRIELG